IPYFHKSGWKIDYIGSISGIERELISSFEYVTYHPISTGKLRRYLSIENFKDPFKILKGVFNLGEFLDVGNHMLSFQKVVLFQSLLVLQGGLEACRLLRMSLISHLDSQID